MLHISCKAMGPPTRFLGTAVADFYFARDGTSSSKLPCVFATDGSEVTMARLVVFKSVVKDTWLDSDEITRISSATPHPFCRGSALVSAPYP
jgi:hypothetical protein